MHFSRRLVILRLLIYVTLRRPPRSLDIPPRRDESHWSVQLCNSTSPPESDPYRFAAIPINGYSTRLGATR